MSALNAIVRCRTARAGAALTAVTLGSGGGYVVFNCFALKP
jgi:hypothetical protein